MTTGRYLFWMVSAVLLILVVMAAACGGPAPAPASPSASPSASPAPKPSPSPVPAPSASPAPTATGPKYGGALNYPLVSAPAGYDGHRQLASSPFVIIPVFNNLVRMDPTKRENDPTNIQGDLAEKWEISSDGKTVTFFLRKGAKWHDGSAFTAGDVIYSFEKIMDPKRSSIASFFPALDKFVKVDDFTVKAQLKTPSPSFMTNLCSGYASIQAAKTASVDFKTSDFLMGTGPFKFSKQTSGVSIELVRNPDYFKKDSAGKQLPYLDSITIWLMSDRNVHTNSFVSGRLNMMSPGYGITNQELLDTFKKLAPAGTVMDKWSPTICNVMFFNHSFEPLKNAKVRRAITLMADRKEMLVAGYGGLDWGNLGSGWFSSFYGLSPQEINAAFEADKPYADRTAEAKKLMADAGYDKGFNLKMISSKTAEIQRRLVWLSDKLSLLNIKAEVSQLDQAVLLQTRSAGDWGICDAALTAQLSDPDEIKNLFYTGDAGNFMKYSNPALDKLWLEQSQALDLTARQKVTRQLEKGLLDDAAAIPTPFITYANAWHPSVKGYVAQVGLYSSAISMERVWIDK